jgi:hypothetical protein
LGRTVPAAWKIRRFRKDKGSPDPDAGQSKQGAVEKRLQRFAAVQPVGQDRQGGQGRQEERDLSRSGERKPLLAIFAFYVPP